MMRNLLKPRLTTSVYSHDLPGAVLSAFLAVTAVGMNALGCEDLEFLKGWRVDFQTRSCVPVWPVLVGGQRIVPGLAAAVLILLCT